MVGTDRVDCTASFVAGFGEEDAVVGARFFDNGGSIAYADEICLPEVVDGHAKVLCEHFDFGFGDPDIAFVGAGAAVSALGTLEVQAAYVPFWFWFFL